LSRTIQLYREYSNDSLRREGILDIEGDGESALAALNSVAPAAAVLDLNLPGMSGKNLCREIKRKIPDLPIVILSAITDVSEKAALLKMGAHDYVTKPFSPRELLTRVRATIRPG